MCEAMWSGGMQVGRECAGGTAGEGVDIRKAQRTAGQPSDPHPGDVRRVLDKSLPTAPRVPPPGGQ